MSLFPSYSASNFLQILVYSFIFFIASILYSVFFPFGIFFIVFSIVRMKTSSQALRTTSLVFQIILAGLSFLVGLSIGILVILISGGFYGGSVLFSFVAFLLGLFMALALEIGVIVWEGALLRDN